MGKVVSLRVEAGLVRQLSDLAREDRVGVSIEAAKLLARGLADERMDRALARVRSGQVTAWKASEIAGVDLWTMLDRMQREGIGVPYSWEEAREDRRPT